MQSLCPYIPVITKPWDFSMNLHGCKIFSKIYLIRAYHQVPDSRIRCVQNRSHYWTPIWSIRIFKNDVRCKKRCANLSTVYRWNSSMYVLIFAYIDDLLIFSETADEHSKHLPTVFDKLTDGVTINPSKSLFGVTSLEFLSYQIHEKGITSISSVRIHVIFLHPIQSPNFFDQHAEELSAVLYGHLSQLQKQDPSNKHFYWAGHCNDEFKDIKHAQAKGTLLSYPIPKATILPWEWERYSNGDIWEPIILEKTHRNGKEMFQVWSGVIGNVPGSNFRHFVERRTLQFLPTKNYWPTRYSQKLNKVLVRLPNQLLFQRNWRSSSSRLLSSRG